MSDLDPKVLGKIKKCLALSGSPNPNEAAIAMRQAHALMRQHGVEAHHVTMSEIGESTTSMRTMARDKPANWEVFLASTVGKAFGCKLLTSRSVYPKIYREYANEGHFIFIGLKAQSEIAAYTTEVLSRKCKIARSRWITESRKSSGINKAKATRMGDAFADGWVHSIAKLVADFANPAEVSEAIDKHVEQKNVESNVPTRKLTDKKIGLAESYAALEGMRAAEGESIYRPMEKGPALLAIEGGS